MNSVPADINLCTVFIFNMDSDGNRVDYYRYLKDFVDEKESQGYKNWKYNYLDELDNKDDRRKEQAITMTVGLNVPIPGVKGLTVDGQFMYERTNAKNRTYQNENTYEWDREILGLLGIPGCMLPEVKECSGDLGETEENIFGSRIKIAGCAGDQQADSVLLPL